MGEAAVALMGVWFWYGVTLAEGENFKHLRVCRHGKKSSCSDCFVSNKRVLVLSECMRGWQDS